MWQTRSLPSRNVFTNALRVFGHLPLKDYLTTDIPNLEKDIEDLCKLLPTSDEQECDTLIET